MVVGCKMVKRDEAQAFVSAGNTGGALAASILYVGRIRGILRPALIGPFPTLKGVTLILDMGANADVRPEHIQQFAIMGALYSQAIIGVQNPIVRILSNGEEAGKGNQLVIASSKLLEQTPGLNFQGNIESKDVPDWARRRRRHGRLYGQHFRQDCRDDLPDDRRDYRGDQEKPNCNLWAPCWPKSNCSACANEWTTAITAARSCWACQDS